MQVSLHGDGEESCWAREETKKLSGCGMSSGLGLVANCWSYHGRGKHGFLLNEAAVFAGIHMR